MRPTKSRCAAFDDRTNEETIDVEQIRFAEEILKDTNGVETGMANFADVINVPV
jgi:hypothetical protein